MGSMTLPVPRCDQSDCRRWARFAWLGRFLCQPHAWQEHERGFFKMCPWHSYWCPCRRTKARVSDKQRKRQAA